MRSQFWVEEDVEPENLEADISVFVAARVCSGDLRLMRNAGFDDDVLDSIHNLFEIYAIFVKPVCQLVEIPLGCIFSILVIGATLNVVICLLVYRVISQMNKSLIQVFGIIRVFLCRKTYEAFLEQEYFQGIKASNKNIDTEVIFEPVDEVGVWDVLWDYISVLLVHLGLWPNNLDTFAAWTGRRFHDVHVLVTGTFTLDAEFTVVLREDVGLRAKVKLTCPLKHLLRPLNVLPHQIFSPNLERLGEVVYLLILRRVLELLRLAHSGPENVPFCTVWRDDSYSCCLHSIDNRVVYVCGIMHFKA